MNGEPIGDRSTSEEQFTAPRAHCSGCQDTGTPCCAQHCPSMADWHIAITPITTGSITIASKIGLTVAIARLHSAYLVARWNSSRKMRRMRSLGI